MPDEATALSIRELRHAIRHNLAGVFALLEGQPGLDKEERLARLAKVTEVLDATKDLVAAAAKITEQRDDAAHAAFKAVIADAAQAEEEDVA